MKKMKGFAAVMAAVMICSGAAAAEGNQNKVEVNYSNTLDYLQNL